MGGSGGNGSQTLEELRGAVAAHRLVNLTGPLGVGKSRLAARLDDTTRIDLDLPRALSVLRRALADPATARRTLVIDGVDGRQRREAVSAALDEDTGARRPSLVVVSRRPVLADPRWAHPHIAALALPPACDGLITTMAAAVESQEGRALAVRLAGGIPLLADAACRALACSPPPASPGAIADQLAEVILERVGRELPGLRWRHALRTLATVRAADEELLPGGPDQFTRLAALSIVERGALGLRITEPYRTILELAYRWRRPQAHESARSHARDYRLTLLGRAHHGRERAELADHGLFLTGHPLLRRELFPAGERTVGFRTALATDGDDIARLMHEWALHSGFDPRRCERLTERWAADDVSAFHLALDRDGRAIGVANLMPIGARTADGVEPLLQQHSGTLTGGGLFLGAAHCRDPAARAHLLRHVLRQGVEAGRLVVSTASPDYQNLIRGLGFRGHGGIRDDVYRCGRNPEVFSNDLAATALPDWLGRIARGDAPAPGPGPSGTPRLSPKELRILLDYTSGMTLDSAARRAGITPNTAKDYLGRVKAKYRAAGRPTHTKIDLARRVREDRLDHS
ncbi:helix-turn-helix transcriptional regulator [Streptomyces sp. BE20]|nr:helix-turn-helix transcriptional regulator [Streptomyces sp. BE20]